jgi:Uma2 family endonuclease
MSALRLQEPVDATDGEAPPDLAVAGEAPQLRRWTCEQFQMMGDAGVFGHHPRVELIDGEIYDMSPMNRPHFVGCIRARDALQAALGAGFTVSDQLPIRLDELSEPCPDVAVIEGDVEDYGDDELWRVLLIVEGSDTSLRFDRSVKSSLYARAGIPEYWIVDVVRRRVEVRRDPGENASEASGPGYASIQIFMPGQHISPLAAPGTRVAVDELLPRERKGK